MTVHRLIGLGLAVCGVLGVVRSGAAQCEPVDGVSFVCGPVSPEDLVAVPDEPWVIAAGMEDNGYLYAVGVRDHRTEVIFPTASVRSRPDPALAGCGSPRVEGFRPHGLSLRPGTGGRHTLYVVRHGARESIEVFDLDVGGPVPTLTWSGCVVAPDGVVFNSVTALPEGGFAATHFRRPTGALWEWQADTGWIEVPGSTSMAPNGLLVSPDGRWFYIGGYESRSVVRLSRGETPVRKEAVEVDFNVDNLRWAPDGALLAAGHMARRAEDFGRCWRMRDCDAVTSHVARVDPERLTAEEIVRYRSNAHFFLGTVAIQVGEEVWLGGVVGSDRIARFPVP